MNMNRRPKAIKPQSIQQTLNTTAAPETKHISIRVSPELHRKLHIRARSEDKTLSTLIIELATDYLQSGEREPE